MRNFVCVFIIAVILVSTSIIFASCNNIYIKEYPAINNTYQFAIDNSIPLSNISNAVDINQSRGFRGETYIRLGTDEAYPESGENYLERLKNQIELYDEDGIKLMQVYVYLIDYCDKDIPDSALTQLKAYFETINSYGIKILLRFAYEYSPSMGIGPTTSDIQRHCQQLKGFINQNAELFNKTVYAVQLGMIGLWGEGHSSVHRLNVVKVIEAVADMIPEDFTIMVRTPQILTKVSDELEYRFGLHDDFLVGYNHEWGMMDWESEEYPKLLTRCKYTLNDGELPWGSQFDINDLNTLGIVKQCVDYGLTSLSIEHNYKEDGNAYWLELCKDEYLTSEYLTQNNMPFNPNLLTDGKISIYDYLKYHLGYQLVASNLKIEANKASFMITNFGFSAPHNYTMRVYVDGKQVNTYEEFNALDLKQFGQKIYTFDYTQGDIQVEFVNKRDSSDTIKLFNDIQYQSGKNLIFDSGM